jgi:dTDP-4-dehydrorhamnose 3,5-epimerase-like enzyme
MQAKIISVDSITDSRGNLIVGEFPKTLPFSPVRFFIVRDVPTGASRGNHAHKTNQQALFCLSGRVVVKVSDGKSWQEFNLVPGLEGLHIPALHWGEQIYVDPGTSLLVLASEAYSSDGYLHTLEELAAYLDN